MRQGVAIVVGFGALYVLAGWQPQIAVGVGVVVGLAYLTRIGALLKLNEALRGG